MSCLTRRGAAALLLLLLIAGCGGATRFSDALRIRPEREGSYTRAPNAVTTRDGRTLRGTVKGVVIAPAKGEEGGIDTSYVFLDATLPDKPANYERIPIGDVERIATLTELPADTVFDNINVVESFNTTQMIPELRRVPVFRFGTAGAGTPDGNQECNCQPLSLGFSLPGIECVARDYAWWFVELRGAYGTWVDAPTRGTRLGREEVVGEGTLGLRFGGADEWGAGIFYSSGFSNYDAFKGTEATRPLVMAQLRYQMPGPVTNILGFCMKPYAFGQFGFSLDEATANLIRYNTSSPEDCGECAQLIEQLEAEGTLSEVDLSMPFSYGAGLGVEFPLTSFLDIAVDVTWRSIGYGEEAELAGFANVPSQRRVDLFLLRAGVTF